MKWVDENGNLENRVYEGASLVDEMEVLDVGKNYRKKWVSSVVCQIQVEGVMKANGWGEDIQMSKT